MAAAPGQPIESHQVTNKELRSVLTALGKQWPILPTRVLNKRLREETREMRHERPQGLVGDF